VEEIEMGVDAGNRSFGRNKISSQIGNTLAGVAIALALLAGQSDHAQLVLDRAFGFAHGMASKAATAQGIHLARLQCDRFVAMLNGVVRVI
jgi:hypothetical protein